MARIRVKKVIDGDTFEDTKHRFYRLASVDAPEKRERGYQVAKEALKNFIQGKELMIKQEGTSYGRKVVTAKIPREKATINVKMRRKGYS